MLKALAQDCLCNAKSCIILRCSGTHLSPLGGGGNAAIGDSDLHFSSGKGLLRCAHVRRRGFRIDCPCGRRHLKLEAVACWHIATESAFAPRCDTAFDSAPQAGVVDRGLTAVVTFGSVGQGYRRGSLVATVKLWPTLSSPARIVSNISRRRKLTQGCKSTALPAMAAW